jgi:hypothetical protein
VKLAASVSIRSKLGLSENLSVAESPRRNAVFYAKARQGGIRVIANWRMAATPALNASAELNNACRL